MKRGVLAAAAAFGIGLALIIGLRLETAGLAVLAGVACGILATLPLSLALWWALAREREARQRLEERRWESPPQAVSPPVLILHSGRGTEMLPGGNAPAISTPREFVIVGEEEHQTDAHR